MALYAYIRAHPLNGFLYQTHYLRISVLWSNTEIERAIDIPDALIYIYTYTTI